MADVVVFMLFPLSTSEASMPRLGSGIQSRVGKLPTSSELKPGPEV